MPQQSKIPKWLIVLFFLVALFGFVDATYLTVEHFLNTTPPCYILTGCDTVTTSSYSVIMGIPVALLGALYYLFMMVLALFILDSKRHHLLQHLAFFSWAGIAAAIYFTAIQAFIIKAYCLYCLGSAVSSVMLFFIAQHKWRIHKRQTSEQVGNI